jgi:hypothetical protein
MFGFLCAILEFLLVQIPTNMNGLIEYRAHPFWLQKYCPSHEMDGTPRCCSCERMEVVQFEFGVVTTLLGYISCCMPKLSQFIPKLFIYLSAKGIKICIAG